MKRSKLGFSLSLYLDLVRFLRVRELDVVCQFMKVYGEATRCSATFLFFHLFVCRFHSEKHFYTPQPRRRSWFTPHDSAQNVVRKKSFGLCEDDAGGPDENGWLSNIHSASSSRSASLANSSIAQVTTTTVFFYAVRNITTLAL